MTIKYSNNFILVHWNRLCILAVKTWVVFCFLPKVMLWTTFESPQSRNEHSGRDWLWNKNRASDTAEQTAWCLGDKNVGVFGGQE